MKKFPPFFLCLPACAVCIFSACTYNISMAHTEGSATDVIDDTASNTPNVSPTVTIPLPAGAIP